MNQLGTILFFSFLIILTSFTIAQEKKIDASKPTNLYTQLYNSLEWQRTGDGTNLYGYRGNISYATKDQSNLVFAEIPILYNDKTTKFGLSDIRLRYFHLFEKDYTKKFDGVWGASVDIFAPTGSFEDGLGTSAWVVAPGILTGLIFSKKIQSFPIVSYQYTSKPTTDIIPDSAKSDGHGLTFQAITVFNLDTWFLWVTPIFVVPLSGSNKKSNFLLELQPSIPPIGVIRPSAFFRYDFNNEAFDARLTVSVYL